jgi:predicted nucleic acid-binding protein
VTPVVVDASALAALVFQEPESDRVSARLKGMTVTAPVLLKTELASVARQKARRHPVDAARIFAALDLALDDRSGLVWYDVNAVDVAIFAHATGMTVYDASYVWLSGLLGADLITLDERLARATRTLSAEV